MKIIKYVAVAAIAIGLCATQCRGLTPEELQQNAKTWLNTYIVDKKLNDDQKTLIAAYLFWHIRAYDAEGTRDNNAYTTAMDAATAATLKAGPAWDAMAVAMNTARTAKLAIEAVEAQARSNVTSWEYTEGVTYRASLESFYVALWNSDKRLLDGKVVPYADIGGVRGRKFAQPVNGKVGPLHP